MHRRRTVLPFRVRKDFTLRKFIQNNLRVCCVSMALFLPTLSHRWKEGEEKETRERQRRAGKGERAKEESEERSKEEERYMIQAVTEKLQTTLSETCARFSFSDSGTDDEDDEEEDTPKKKTKKKTTKDSSPSASSAKEKKSKSKGKALKRRSDGLTVLWQALPWKKKHLKP